MKALVRSLIFFLLLATPVCRSQEVYAISNIHITRSLSRVQTAVRQNVLANVLLLKADRRPFSKWASDHLRHRERPLLWIFFEAMLLGILAVFTPYVYAVLPMTLSYISVLSRSRGHKLRNSVYYALALISIFLALGLLLSILISTTGFYQLADHWIFNLVFFRIFLMLGLSFLGAFEINLPVKWAHKIDKKAGVDSVKEIFFMALSLPVVTISSTGPIAGLVLLFAGRGGFLGPVFGMLGFSLGFVSPFIFPSILNLISRSINWLNHVKVLLGFGSLLLCLKFLSNADIALDWNLIDNDIFIAMMLCLSLMMGLYMLGIIRLTNDYLHIQNVYGQEYVSLSRLFLAIAFLSFAVYLLPGLWGAPLNQIQGFLPSQ